MRKVITKQRFIGGIADYESEGTIADSYAYGRSIDVRTDPRAVTILPRTIKESGSVVTDLLKWADTYPSSLTTYLYGDTGRLYARTSAGSTSLIKTVGSSSGNGLVYSPDDDFLWYTSDKVIGRYGPLAGTPSSVDDYFGSQGGVPLNTSSLDLEAGSSQYASRADTASLSITSDLCIEGYIKPESLPAVGSSMVLFSKWDIDANKRSYKFEIYAASGYFGDGTDGALTISSDTTEAPIDSAATATSGAFTISATNASFASGQEVLLHQTRGTGAGTWQRNTITGYSAGTITCDDANNAAYTSGAQVRVLKQYTNVTIDSGKTYTAKAWDGTVGGILAFIASGTVTVTGTITTGGPGPGGGFSSAAGGFFGGNVEGGQGEGTAGARNTVSTSANGNGGGGSSGGTNGNRSGAGGGGHSAAGGTGTGTGGTAGTGGAIAGSADLTTMVLGGGGGCATGTVSSSAGFGGYGGGIIFISGATVTVTGSIKADGTDGQVGGTFVGPGGGGAGGSILIKAQTATLGTGLLLARGGLGATGGGGTGGDGASGRIHLDYYTSYTGTTTPTLDVIQDNTLVTNTTYQLRLGLSSNGTAEEYLTKNSTLTTGSWYHVAVSWDASASTATFYQDAVSLGSSVGAVTSLNDNASVAGLGADFNSTARNFYDGLIDEVRVWNTERTATQIYNNKDVYVAANATGLVAWYKLNGDVTDSQTSGNNNLTASGSPTYSTSVPYPAPTTRLDIDQSASTASQTYALATAINEGATHRLTFTPAKDPQKSIQFNISAVGSSADWTITIHDSLNNTVATSTVTNANLHTGDYEFTYSSVFRPRTNFTNNYHAHITATNTTGTPAVVTSSSNNLETADYVTYYQFLVEDTDWHPMVRFLNFWVVGNERHVGKYDATTYTPHTLTFPAGYRVRTFGYFREYLAIGVMRGTNIYDFDSGRIYFWDGYSTTFNYFIDVPEGGINALFGSRGKLYIVAGYQGELLEYSGGEQAYKIRSLPNMEADMRVEVYPQAMTMWRGLLRYAPTVSNSTTLERLVYTYGSKNLRYPEILTADYVISTGNYNSNVKVSLLHPVGQKLLVGWQDNTSYGIDYVDLSNDPFPTARIELLVEDNESSQKEKLAQEIIATFNSLNSGESVATSYLFDEETSFRTNPDTTSTNDEVLRQIPTNEGRHREMQVAVDLATTTTTAPTLTSITTVIDTLEGEDRIG